ENIRKVLAAGYSVEGRVIYADTRKPVPRARLEFANPIVNDQADAQGRFRVSLFSPIPDGPKTQQRGEHVAAFAYPPEGEPYLTGTANLHFPKGVVRREVEIALPRAVLVRGKITEAGSGKPVAGAYLECPGYWNVRVRSGPDGSCQMGVPEGTKRL